jgi:hypothetical protein
MIDNMNIDKLGKLRRFYQGILEISRGNSEIIPVFLADAKVGIRDVPAMHKKGDGTVCSGRQGVSVFAFFVYAKGRKGFAGVGQAFKMTFRHGTLKTCPTWNIKSASRLRVCLPILASERIFGSQARVATPLSS